MVYSYPQLIHTSQSYPSLAMVPIYGLIGSVSLSNCRDAADKLLTVESFSAILTVLISCIVTHLFPCVTVKYCLGSDYAG